MGNFGVEVSVCKNTTYDRIHNLKNYADTGIRTNIFQFRRSLLSCLNVLFLRIVLLTVLTNIHDNTILELFFCVLVIHAPQRH